MREIKFKIWTGKKMVTPSYCLFSQFYINADGKAHQYKNAKGEWYLSECNKKVRVLLYTGLKDRNGKDIYEGDIVSGWSEPSKKIIHSKVVFQKGAYYLLTSGDVFFDYLTNLYPAEENSNTGIKIIGNVYENPELLEGERP